MSVQSVKIEPFKREPFKTEPNENRKNSLDLVVLNKPNGCYF